MKILNSNALLAIILKLFQNYIVIKKIQFSFKISALLQDAVIFMFGHKVSFIIKSLKLN